MSDFKLGLKTEYKTEYDPTLLDFFSRESRRKEKEIPIFGYDIWRAYELSFLLPSGVPWFGVIEIINPANSGNIFESKSLKLYLNSFNNTVFSGVDEVLLQIRRDLSIGTKNDIQIQVITQFKHLDDGQYINLDFLNINASEYNYNKDLLIREEKPWRGSPFFTNLLRSNCEVTNQPDWGRVSVYYRSNYTLNLESFLQYIISFRNHQGFHEIVCETIYYDLYKLLEPQSLTVICQYTRRGGIDINPVRSNSNALYSTFLPKLTQQ